MQVQGSQEYQRNNYLMNFGNNAPAVLYDYIGAAQPRDSIELYSLHGRTGAGPVITMYTNFHYVLFVFYGDGVNGVTNRLDIYVDGTNAAENVRGLFTSPLTSADHCASGRRVERRRAMPTQVIWMKLRPYDLTTAATNADQVTATPFTASTIMPRPWRLSRLPEQRAGQRSGDVLGL